MATVTLLRLSGNVAAVVSARPCDTVHQVTELAAVQDPSLRFSKLVGGGRVLPGAATLGSLGVLHAAPQPGSSVMDAARDGAPSAASVPALTATLQVVLETGPYWHKTVKGMRAEIGDDGRTARRVDSFCAAIVFCAAPRRCCRIRISQLESGWAGSLELGFCQRPPEELDFQASTCNALDVADSAASGSSSPWNGALAEGDILELELPDDNVPVVRFRGTAFPISSGRSSAWCPGEEVYPFAGIYGKTKAIELLP